MLDILNMVETMALASTLELLLHNAIYVKVMPISVLQRNLL